MIDPLNYALGARFASFQPYQANRQRVAVKLDAMENPYNPLAQHPQGERLDALAVNLYPDPDAHELKATLRALLELPAEQHLSLGNGSDELILNLCLLCGERGVLALAPSFVLYERAARIVGADFHSVDLRVEDFSLDLEATLAAIERERPALIFLAAPNNPTGNLFSEAEIAAICAQAPGLVVIDEAYRAFSPRSYSAWARAHPQVVVMGTFSKLGLAGLRLGFAHGHPEVIAKLEAVRLPYNIGSVNQELALHLLARYRETIVPNCARVCAERDKLYEQLSRHPERWRCFPSCANFITIRCLTEPAASAHQRLLERSILVKNLHGAHPALSQCLRLSVGTESDNSAMLEALLAD